MVEITGAQEVAVQGMWNSFRRHCEGGRTQRLGGDLAPVDRSPIGRPSTGAATIEVAIDLLEIEEVERIVGGAGHADQLWHERRRDSTIQLFDGSVK